MRALFAVHLPEAAGHVVTYAAETHQEDYLIPLGLSATALAKAVRVSAQRMNDIVRERRGVTAERGCDWRATLAAMRAHG